MEPLTRGLYRIPSHTHTFTCTPTHPLGLLLGPADEFRLLPEVSPSRVPWTPSFLAHPRLSLSISPLSLLLYPCSGSFPSAHGHVLISLGGGNYKKKIVLIPRRLQLSPQFFSFPLQKSYLRQGFMLLPQFLFQFPCEGIPIRLSSHLTQKCSDLRWKFGVLMFPAAALDSGHPRFECPRLRPGHLLVCLRQTRLSASGLYPHLFRLMIPTPPNVQARDHPEFLMPLSDLFFFTALTTWVCPT